MIQFIDLIKRLAYLLHTFSLFTTNFSLFTTYFPLWFHWLIWLTFLLHTFRFFTTHPLHTHYLLPTFNLFTTNFHVIYYYLLSAVVPLIDLIKRSVSLTGSPEDVARRNAAMCLSRLTKHPPFLQRIRDLRGIEIMMTFASKII